jgi:hypothetical protein
MSIVSSHIDHSDKKNLFRDILNELRRLKLISQSLTNIYTLNQCHELKSATSESQVIFLFYMMIKLIRKEGYIDENNLEKFLHQYETTSNLEKFHFISKQILREGFLTIEQIVQSTKDFFLQDVNNILRLIIKRKILFFHH